MQYELLHRKAMSDALYGGCKWELLQMQCNVRCPLVDALYGGCKDTQCSAGGCGGSGGEWEETAGGQDAQIQYNTEHKYKIYTQIHRDAQIQYNTEYK